MDPRDDGAPRMTAEEADARFAALVAQYREQKPRRARRSLPSASPTVVLAVVFVVGVFAGAAWHAKALGVALVGVIAIVLVRAIVKRSTSE